MKAINTVKKQFRAAAVHARLTAHAPEPGFNTQIEIDAYRLMMRNIHHGIDRLTVRMAIHGTPSAIYHGMHPCRMPV